MAYFKSSNPEVIEAFKNWFNSREEYRNSIFELSEEVGANPEEVLLFNDEKFAAFIFEEGKQIPPVFIRFPGKNKQAYIPRSNTKEGKMLWKRINSFPKVSSESFTKLIGLCTKPVRDPDSMLYNGFVYFMISDNLPYNPPEYVEEVLSSEYLEAYFATE